MTNLIDNMTGEQRLHLRNTVFLARAEGIKRLRKANALTDAEACEQYTALLSTDTAVSDEARRAVAELRRQVGGPALL